MSFLSITNLGSDISLLHALDVTLHRTRRDAQVGGRLLDRDVLSQESFYGNAAFVDRERHHVADHHSFDRRFVDVPAPGRDLGDAPELGWRDTLPIAHSADTLDAGLPVATGRVGSQAYVGLGPKERVTSEAVRLHGS